MNETQTEVFIRETRSAVTEPAPMPAGAGIEYHGAAIRSPDVAISLGALLILIWGYTRLAGKTSRWLASHPGGKRSAARAGEPPSPGHQGNARTRK